MNEWEWQLLEARTPVDKLSVTGGEIRAGSPVCLHPQAGGDVLDIALANKTAVIESIEQDYEGKFHVCVVVDEDPGRDIGMMRQPGHRFFFDPVEVEAVADHAPKIQQPKLPRILVAGIGNIFLGDDAFGVEVVQRLATSVLPEHVRVVDFGIRGYDLAYALLDGYDVTILVDACPRGRDPGTLYVIEPDLTELGSADEMASSVEAHSMNPLNVLRLATSMGGPLKNRILLLGCEPQTLGPEEGHMGLSATVQGAIDDAVKLIDSLIQEITTGKTSAL